jgi:hypothetical protein
MNRNILVFRGAAVVIGIAALSPHLEIRAQVRESTQGSLKLGESGGEPRGYAFLLPVKPPTGGSYEVFLQLTPESTIPPADQWVWEVDNSPAQIKSDVTFKWFAQASCPDDITLLQVSGPGGTLTQGLPIQNPIWGYFSTQSFTVDTIKNVCEDWANSDKCDPTEPGCQLIELFDLVGGVAPATAADRLRLKASCSSGPLPTLDYAAKVRVRCSRGLF